MTRLEAAFSLHGVATDSNKIKWLQILLGAEGEGLFTDVTPDTTYDTVSLNIKTILGPHDELASAKIRLKNIKCKDYDFIKCAKEIRTLTAKLYAGCPPQLKTLAELDAFVNAMPNDIKSHLELLKFNSLNDCMDSASLKLNQLNATIRNISATPDLTPTPPPQPTPTPTPHPEINNINTSKLDKVVQSLEALSNSFMKYTQRNRGQRGNHHNSQFTHNYAPPPTQYYQQPTNNTFPYPTQQPQNYQSQHTPRGGSRGRGMSRPMSSYQCYTCGGMGHMSRQCPSYSNTTPHTQQPTNTESLNM